MTYTKTCGRTTSSYTLILVEMMTLKRRYRGKNTLIAGLLIVLTLMAVEYSAFSSNLEISGTSSVSSSWNA